eukprot:TRINITY_DN906_c3_g1_i1.p1 TRINITY_DN906_c3_g1~~TRINITY_DN906_c3_g1_i1.p1  ORF type:complete len:617 (+),score=237.77 TRINITY_DN906_c3_g1_i1:72-1922(+)
MADRMAGMRRTISELERSIRAKETKLELRHKMREHSDREALARAEQGGTSTAAVRRDVWRRITVRVPSGADLDTLRVRVARVTGIAEPQLRLQIHTLGERRDVTSLQEALSCPSSATLEAASSAAEHPDDEDEVLVEGGSVIQGDDGEAAGSEKLEIWAHTTILVRQQWTFEQLKRSLWQLTGVPAYMMRIHNGPPTHEDGRQRPRIEFLNMEQAWKTSHIVFWVTQRSVADDGEADAGAATQEERRRVLLQQVEQSERLREDEHRRLAGIEEELAAATAEYQDERDHREMLLRELRSAAERLRHAVADRWSTCKDYLKRGRDGADGGDDTPLVPVESTAVRAIDALQGLTRARETEIRHTERELREIKVLNALRKSRQADLQSESSRRYAAAERDTASAIEQLKERIARERSDLEAKREMLQRDHDDLCERLRWNNQLWTAKDAAVTISGTTPKKSSARERLTREAHSSPMSPLSTPRASGHGVAQPGVAAWSKEEGQVVGIGATGTIEPARGPAVAGGQHPSSGEASVRNTVALTTLNQQKEGERVRMRRLGLELSALLRHAERQRMDAATRGREAQRVAEAAEKECAQYEEQATFLASELKAMRSGSWQPRLQ